MSLRFIPLLTGWLPIIAIHTSLLVAIGSGSIVGCIPYLEGCTSISATGRYEPASFIFKPAMTAEAVIMVFYWSFNVAWIRRLAGNEVDGDRTGKWMLWLGIGGALALILYITFLGTQGPFYEFMRRFGIYLYFLFSVLAQIILARHTIRFAALQDLPDIARIGRMQMFLALIPFAIGALNLILKATLEDADAAENIIEWVFSLLMHVFFLLSYYSWKKTGFGAAWILKADRP